MGPCTPRPAGVRKSQPRSNHGDRRSGQSGVELLAEGLVRGEMLASSLLRLRITQSHRAGSPGLEPGLLCAFLGCEEEGAVGRKEKSSRDVASQEEGIRGHTHTRLGEQSPLAASFPLSGTPCRHPLRAAGNHAHLLLDSPSHLSPCRASPHSSVPQCSQKAGLL